jgi:hypothetical protein
VIICEQSTNQYCVQEEYSDTVEIPQMKCHGGNDPPGKNRGALDQRENTINIGHTAADQDYGGIPACIFLVCQQGYKDSESEIEADMLNIHCINVCTTVSNRYWWWQERTGIVVVRDYVFIRTVPVMKFIKKRVPAKHGPGFWAGKNMPEDILSTTK